MAEQVIKAATLSPTASVLSLKGETKEKAYAVLPLEQRKGSLLVPLGGKTKGKSLRCTFPRATQRKFASPFREERQKGKAKGKVYAFCCLEVMAEKRWKNSVSLAGVILSLSK